MILMDDRPPTRRPGRRVGSRASRPARTSRPGCRGGRGGSRGGRTQGPQVVGDGQVGAIDEARGFGGADQFGSVGAGEELEADEVGRAATSRGPSGSPWGSGGSGWTRFGRRSRSCRRRARARSRRRPSPGRPRRSARGAGPTPGSRRNRRRSLAPAGPGAGGPGPPATDRGGQRGGRIRPRVGVGSSAARRAKGSRAVGAWTCQTAAPRAQAGLGDLGREAAGRGVGDVPHVVDRRDRPPARHHHVHAPDRPTGRRSLAPRPPGR